MKFNIIRTSLILMVIGLGLICFQNMVVAQQETVSNRVVYQLDVDGSVNPAMATYLKKGIQEAENRGAAAVVIRLNTPGGLVDTTKGIIRSMINSGVPVVIYVAPGGSSATSAGALITMGADVAAMAPGTNIGAAHPVGAGGDQIDQVMTEKILNDLTAYMRSVAASKGRNVEWIERAIRQSVSVTAQEAKDLKVIDVVADSMADLLSKIDGMEIKKKGRMVTINTKGAVVKVFESGWRLEFLDILADPYIAYLLMMAGMLGIMMEIYNPGTIFPGVIGVICLLLALFAFQQLPVNYVGVLLLAFGIVLFILEVKIISFGLLTIGGIVCLTVGSIMLFDTGTGESAVRLSLYFVIPTVLFFSAFFVFAMTLALKAWKAKPRTGDTGLIGEEGVAVTDIDNEGRAYLHGEYWNASTDGLIHKGDKIKVIGVENLKIIVTKV